MTATYNPDLSDAISKVRYYLGDTVVGGALRPDETITAVLALYSGAIFAAAADLARSIAAEFAAAVDSNVDGQGEMNSQRYRQFTTLADRLEIKAKAEAASTTTRDSFSGISTFGATSQEVCDARTDQSRARNAPGITYGNSRSN